MGELRRPLGMNDVLPADTADWRRVEAAARDSFRRFGFQEIRTPLLEFTSLFGRSVGEATDIVEKEMYTFGSSPKSEVQSLPAVAPEGAKAGPTSAEEPEGVESLTLRPEITASVIRAVIENSLLKQKTFHKLFYLGPCFRRERPQKGRLRQFHQIGVEVLGSAEPAADVETILVYLDILRGLGIGTYSLRLNSIGCPACRGPYREILKKAVAADLAAYCANCRARHDRNVFRILDCKVEGCRKLAAKLPAAADHLCAECRGHFAAVRSRLDAAGVAHELDPRLVRGLDYYTKTVFEVTSSLLGAQDALAGGGRYDGLVADLGGPPTPAVGFASGIERLLLAVRAAKPATVAEGAHDGEPPLDAYLVSIEDAQRPKTFRLARVLRDRGYSADYDLEGRSLKAQMRNAHRSGARYTVVIGPDEDARGAAKVKEMSTGEEREIAQESLADGIGPAGARA